MAIIGSLTDCSLPEIFQLIEKGHKTGLLTIRTLPSAKISPPVYYLWVYNGCIVAAANRSDHQGLVLLIERHKWVSDLVFDKVVHWCCPLDEPLGKYLKNQGVLQAEQLKRLFQVQVLQQVRALFKLKEAHFKFNSNVVIPTREMTGLSVPATEATLVGLRVLDSWEALNDRLPNPNGGLISIIDGQPIYQLNAQEWQVWEYTRGTVSLKAIAQQLLLPVEKVQQIAFRLIATGLAEEVPLFVDAPDPQQIQLLPERLLEEAQRQNVSHSFMQNLVDFLRSKVLT